MSCTHGEMCRPADSRRAALKRRFRGQRDAVHHLDRFEREIADGRFAGKHAGVGAVEDRVGHVGRFGTRGRGESCMLSSICVAMITGRWKRWHIAMIRFCSIGISSDVDLHAQIAAGHHHGVGCFDDFFQLRRVPRVFRFSRPREPLICWTAECPLSICTSSGERTKRQADEIDARFRRPNRVLAIGLAHCRRAELHAGQIDALPAANRAALHNAHRDAIRLFRDHFHADGAIGQHHAVADLQLVDERRIGRSQLIWRVRLRRLTNTNSSPRLQKIRSFGRFAEANFRSGQIDQDRDRLVDLVAQRANIVDMLLLHRPARHGPCSAERHRRPRRPVRRAARFSAQAGPTVATIFVRAAATSG